MDIVTLAAARKSGGSGGDVTKQYVDGHLALKADKTETKEYPIADGTTGINLSITDSADGYMQGLTIYGRSEVVEGDIESIGDSGSLNVQTCGKNLWDTNNETLFSVTAEGKIWIDSPNSFHSAIFNVKPNTDYTLTCNTSGIGLNIERIASIPTPNLEYGMYVPMIVNETVNTGSGGYTKTFNTGNTNYILISLGDGSKYNLASHFQLELGSTATPYEPYISSSASLTTGLPYCGIPVTSGETYTDEQGQKWLADAVDNKKVVKRCYKVTFDGSADENVQIYSSSATGADGSKAFYINLPYASVPISASVLPNIVTNYNIDTAQNGYDDTSQYDTLVYTSTDGVNLGGRIAGAATASNVKNALASNPVTVVYELAEPYETPLTTEEQQALLALRTFDSTTNVTITDDPFVDISYIKNTANGKAAEQLAENLRVALGWVTHVPEMHRNIFRGKSLGSSVTAAQLAAIVDGSFDDLYVGDYWTIPVTIDGTTVNVNWRIADIDYYLHAGDTPLEEHHLVIVPDTGLYAARMNATASNSGGYKASEMYTTNLGTAKTAINTAFPNMVLSHRDLIAGNPADSPTWADSTAELLSEIMVYGTQIFSPCNGSGQYNNFLTIAKSQFALFRLAPWFGVADATYWLRDVVGSPSFAAVSAEGNADGWGASNEWGVRPYFLLGSAE